MMNGPKAQTADAQFASMDRMYRYQRYFYDLTRKFYLLGRDRLLAEMKIDPGDRVLELGCGTARNLIILAKDHPQTHFYGLDASAEMLRTARSKIDDSGAANIELRTALADDFSYSESFGLEEKFDACFFSYAVSIIPPWREAVANALANLKPGKSLYIVDFFDQGDLPRWFAAILKWWLGLFHVSDPPELIPYLTGLEKDGAGRLTVRPLYRRYAVIIEFRISAS